MFAPWLVWLSGWMLACEPKGHSSILCQDTCLGFGPCPWFWLGASERHLIDVSLTH